MTTTPPGWYDDGRGAQRWWDGVQWTEHVATPDAAASAPVQVAAEQAEAYPPAEAAAYPSAETTAYPSAETAAYPPAEQAAFQPSAPGEVPMPGYPATPQYTPSAGWQQGGAFVAPEKKKSKLWILWVALGVVVVGLAVVVPLVLIPLFLNLTHAFGGGGGTGGDAAQQAAVSTVRSYDHAWNNADCAEFQSATTASFRRMQQIEDCPTFESSSQAFTDTTDNYTLTVTSVDTSGGTISVHTSETYVDPTAPAGSAPIESVITYTLVSEGGAWKIDDVLN